VDQLIGISKLTGLGVHRHRDRGRGRDRGRDRGRHRDRGRDRGRDRHRDFCHNKKYIYI
jgi:hypothetical protein